MSERRQILTLVGITAVIGLVAVALIGYLPPLLADGDAVVERYRATFYLDGTLTEEYTYIIRAKRFRMLFRTWEAPLSAEALDGPYIQPVEIEAAPAIGYFKDHRGSVFVEEPYDGQREIVDAIRSLAERNEVGAYDPDMFEVGRYTVRYVFDVHPPLEFNDDLGHLNLKLARDHIAYRDVELTFEGADRIVKLYPHPPTLRKIDRGDRIIVQGRSGRDELIEVEMLLDKDALEMLDGFPRKVDDIEAKTVNANRLTSIRYHAALTLREGTRITALLMPALLYAVYHVYGREREYTVPRYLSYVPNKDRKPWVVNQIFKEGALDYDDDGFYATLLDLHRRKKIEITPKPAGLLIEILDPDVDDSYEKRVMEFLE
ncbi:MAG: DUF2207 domain-containing protein, partial [Candidatus Bathyarchaeia archaeon]